MGTEVFVFFLAAFDRPFDKTTEGMDLDLHPGEELAASAIAAGSGVTGGVAGSGVVGGGTVIINGGGGATVGNVVGNGEEASRWEGGPVNIGGEEASRWEGGPVNIGGGGAVIAPQQPIEQQMAEDLKDATSNYIEELNHLTEMLTQVSEQSKRLTRDSEEMENLNRTLTGISRVYEMQLKSASAQISTIDEINEQTRHMAEQIVELNKIYARMIEAMQVKAGVQ